MSIRLSEEYHVCKGGESVSGLAKLNYIHMQCTAECHGPLIPNHTHTKHKNWMARPDTKPIPCGKKIVKYIIQICFFVVYSDIFVASSFPWLFLLVSICFVLFQFHSSKISRGDGITPFIGNILHFFVFVISLGHSFRGVERVAFGRWNGIEYCTEWCWSTHQHCLCSVFGYV